VLLGAAAILAASFSLKGTSRGRRGMRRISKVSSGPGEG